MYDIMVQVNAQLVFRATKGAIIQMETALHGKVCMVVFPVGATYLKNVKGSFIQTEHFDAFYIHVKNDQMIVQQIYQRAFLN